MKVFFFGGTFDPPHLGHYGIAEACLKRCDKLIIFPNLHSVDKLNSSVSSKHRLNMLRILFSNLDIEIDNFEINSKKKNYTFHTIKYLLEKYNKGRITMVIGQDQALNFKNWYKNDEISKLVDICYFSRFVKQQKNNQYFGFKKLSDFQLNVSSSDIRIALKQKRYLQVKKYIDINVLDYIKENNLYV